MQFGVCFGDPEQCVQLTDQQAWQGNVQCAGLLYAMQGMGAMYNDLELLFSVIKCLQSPAAYSSLYTMIQGLVAMSAELELIYTALVNNQVPQQWAQVAYPSLKPLGAWLKDLQARVAFFSSWLRRGVPACFWMAAFFFPQVPCLHPA